jgi:RNA polymerase sigma factor (sigma-70 family)
MPAPGVGILVGSTDVTAVGGFDNYRHMGSVASAKVSMSAGPARSNRDLRAAPQSRTLAEFERLYRLNVEVVMGYFARRCAEPQTVADLTSETFVRAAAGFAGFDPGRGSARAWVFGIAAHVYVWHCERAASGRDAVARLAGRRVLEDDEIDELAGKIDAERAGRELIARCAELPALERAAIELVDLSGLTPKEAAAVLGVSRVVLRKRLSRARTRLRKEHQGDE